MKVVAAILIYNKKILAFRRPYEKNKPQISLKYEFPGGKIENNETEIIALKRELKEELELNIYDFKKYYNTIHNYTEYEVDISFYISYLKNLSFKLNFHSKYKIMNVKDLKKLDWLEADYEIIDYIQTNGFHNS